MKKNEKDELEKIHTEFLNRWPIEKIEKLTLEEYVGVENKDTFCQWVETKTRKLGSIKGLTSIKFGIYERKKNKQKPKNYKNDDKYSWSKNYGDYRHDVFKKIKNNIIKIIELSKTGKFKQIDNIQISDFFKWKIAFLYSNQKLVPIYKKDILLRIANYYGLSTNKNTSISEIQSIMMFNKPIDKNIYEFMRFLYDKFSKNNDENTEQDKQPTRKSSSNRSTETQLRNVENFSYEAKQIHNKIQLMLRDKLAKEYGEENVHLEENYVDVKLVQPKYIALYEVKSNSNPTECIKEALGQLLFYTSKEKDEILKKLFIVGKSKLKKNDKEYINFLKNNLKIEFEYLYLPINDD